MPEPDPLTAAWQRLAKADELVQGFGERGWIAAADLEQVRVRTETLARRVGRSESAAGADSDRSALGREVREVTDLLVALSDEAVERQPDLAPEVPVEVTLADARRRLDATRDAYGAG